MRRCSLSAPKTFAPGPVKSSAPPTCPKSALSPLPLIRQLPPLPTTRIRDEKCYASGASGHQPTLTPLKKLFFSDTQLTDAGLEKLKGLTALQSLGLSHTKVTDVGLEKLKGLTAL